MLKPIARSATLGLVTVLSACGTGRGTDLHPGADFILLPESPYLSRAHSHNNYEQRNPLFTALGSGFASIEVDVVLLDGELYVAHGIDEVDEGVTLRSAYLDPLRNIVRNTGTVHDAEQPPLQFLVDVKTDGDATYAVVHDVLGEYAEMLTTWDAGGRTPGAVSVVISGNRPALRRLEAEGTRYVALDGRLLDDRAGVSPDVMPLVSADWDSLGPPEREARLRRAERIIDQMHAEGRKVRFWATPDDEELWGALVALGVDYVGVDQLERLSRFFQNHTDRTGSAID